MTLSFLSGDQHFFNICSSDAVCNAPALQYDGSYANGASTNDTHNAVYNSLFDDSPVAQPASQSGQAEQNGHASPGDADPADIAGQGYNGWANRTGSSVNTQAVTRLEAMMAVLSQQVGLYLAFI